MSPEPMSVGEALIRDLERFKPDGLSLNAWAVGAGVNRAVWGDIRRHGNPSRRTLDKLLGFAGSSLAEFEALRVGSFMPERATEDGGLRDRSHGWADPLLRPIPCLSAAVGPSLSIDDKSVATVLLSATSEGQVDRPRSLAIDQGVYAFRLPIDALLPRFRLGRTIIVAPHRRCEPGDDVLALIASSSAETQALLGELIDQRGDWLTVRQFNPAVAVRVPRSRIEALHHVIGEAI